jgi:hypothetical protein
MMARSPARAGLPRRPSPQDLTARPTVSSALTASCSRLVRPSALIRAGLLAPCGSFVIEPDPLIDLVSSRQAAQADRYQLRIP